jgi:GLPGLI family protein
MKIIVKLIIITILLLVSKLNAQEFQGIATYKTKRQVDIKLDSTKIESAMQKQIKEMLKKQFEKTYTLRFNREESIYEEEESLGAPTPGGMRIMSSSSSGGDIMFKNTKLKTYTNQNEFFGKVFLIQDDLKPIKWELGSETKNIGAYTCFKATIAKEVEVFKNSMTINGKKKDNEVKLEPTMKTQVTTAWYTTQIPVNTGPSEYFGLPGLILEINDGSITIICSKVVLNPENKIDIEEPENGKKVNQSEFDTITVKKMKENQERYRSNGRGDGEHIEIRIGG